MNSMKNQVKDVNWRSWDVKAVADNHKLYGPLPTAADDFAYVVDNESNNDYGRFLRLGALANLRLEEFATAVRTSLVGMAAEGDSQIEALAREVRDVERRLDSTSQSYEQLRTVEQKLRLIDSLDGRVGKLETAVRESPNRTDAALQLNVGERQAIGDLSNGLGQCRRELSVLSSRMTALEERDVAPANNPRRSTLPDDRILLERPAATMPAWLPWALAGIGILVALDVLLRLVK